MLAVVSQAWSRHCGPEDDLAHGEDKLARKIALVQEAERQGLAFRFCDFGTRRRFSRRWQSQVVATLKDRLPESFVGTSNVRLAMDMNLTPIGTMAHEWLMAAQALGPRLADSQRFALDHWVHEYRGDLGINQLGIGRLAGQEALNIKHAGNLSLTPAGLSYAGLFDR